MPVLRRETTSVGLLADRSSERLGSGLLRGLAQYFEEMEEDDEVRCVVITGDDSAGAFSAGANLKDPNTHNTGSPAKFLRALSKKRDVSPFDMFNDFETGNRGGERLCHRDRLHHTFCCDLIVASEKAEWRLPQIGLGIIPAYGGSARLARWVGKGLATRLAMGFPTGRRSLSDRSCAMAHAP